MDIQRKLTNSSLSTNTEIWTPIGKESKIWERERERGLPQVVAQPNPLGFLPSVITEEEKGEILYCWEGRGTLLVSCLRWLLKKKMEKFCKGRNFVLLGGKRNSGLKGEKGCWTVGRWCWCWTVGSSFLLGGHGGWWVLKGTMTIHFYRTRSPGKDTWRDRGVNHDIRAKKYLSWGNEQR
jgi:hypothetical protein